MRPNLSSLINYNSATPGRPVWQVQERGDKGPDGKELSASEKAKMMARFEDVGGDLHLANSVLSDGKISPNERDAIASDLVSATADGKTVELKNPDGLHSTDVTLRREGGDVVASVTRADPATNPAGSARPPARRDSRASALRRRRRRRR